MVKKDILKEIVAKKVARLILAKEQLSIEALKEQIAVLPPTRPFLEAINPRSGASKKGISLIAEIKQTSPSQGMIRQDFSLEQVAASYQEAGVQAISVLTEEDYFNGKPEYINIVKGITTVPILRKDFIIDEYQVYESRALGADAILLIADLLTKEKLVQFMQIADTLGLDYIVEVHDEKELKKVLGLKVNVIGINNRNLRTLEVDFKTTEKLFTLIPRGKIVIVESGIKSGQDILFLKILGANAVLIGTVFMSAPDIKSKVEEVMGW